MIQVVAGLVAGGLLFLAAWAGWREGRREDPPYRGVHEPRGRHREREWRSGQDALE